jgi:propanediol dehydratase small subunit
VLSAVRDVINEALPHGYVEGIAFGMIGWSVPLERFPDTYNGQPLSYVALAAQKRYYSLYLNSVYAGSVEQEALRRQWETTGRKLDMGKSCIRFTTLDDLDLDLVSEVVASTPVDEFIRVYEQMRHAHTAG